MEDEMMAALQQRAQESDFWGVVSVTQADEPLLQRAFGWRDVKNKLANEVGTRFGIASGTKLFTALGIGALIDAGLLTLETTVGEINGRYAGFIHPTATIQQLLSHTSGIFDYYDEEIIEDFDNFFVDIPWYQLETPADYWPLFEGQTAKFAPGERYAYSNGGYVFLGMLIEKISGKLYRKFIHETVLQPAGMLNSGFFALNDLPANSANGYMANRQTTNIFNLPIRGGGDGGLFTTVTDMARFWPALFGGKIISRPLLASFLQTQHRLNAQRGYASGLYKWLDNARTYLVGSDAGVGFQSYHVPAAQLTLTVLSNVTDGEEAVIDFLLNLPPFAEDQA